MSSVARFFHANRIFALTLKWVNLENKNSDNLQFKFY